jgi:hypothetical protein
MFSRNLTEKEIEMTGIIEGFVREKHAHSIGHDYSHIIEVTRDLNRDSDHFLACHMVYNRQSFLFC